MKIKILLNIIILIIFSLNYSLAAINNSIVAKIGDKIITSLDVENEIRTILIITKQELNQKNVENTKGYAVKSLIRTTLKRSEIEKFKITVFNEVDLEKYLNGIAIELNLEKNDLKDFFQTNGLNYKIFKEKYKTELLWNTLIFSLYQSQITINNIDLEQELSKALKNNQNMEIDKEKIREKIIEKQKSEKLNLFSRSHYSTLENTILINFK